MNCSYLADCSVCVQCTFTIVCIVQYMQCTLTDLHSQTSQSTNQHRRLRHALHGTVTQYISLTAEYNKNTTVNKVLVLLSNAILWPPPTSCHCQYHPAHSTDNDNDANKNSQCSRNSPFPPICQVLQWGVEGLLLKEWLPKTPSNLSILFLSGTLTEISSITKWKHSPRQLDCFCRLKQLRALTAVDRCHTNNKALSKSPKD